MKIPLLHLEDGNHHFEEVIKGGTLHFYREELFPNDLNVSVDLNKFGKNISCSLNLKTRAKYQCDRCLVEFNSDIEEISNFLFHRGHDKIETEEEEVIILSPDQKEIDLTCNIEELLILSVPMKLLCKEECKGICPECGADLNNESCVCHRDLVDPRWEELRKLKK